MSLDLYINDEKGNELFWKNITHNLNTMADKAGVYKALWRPNEINCKYAKDILPILEKGLNELKSNPDKYKKYNPDNGWGDYHNLINFIEETIKACKEFPNGKLYACK